MKKKIALGVGVGVATAAAAATGYYFFGAKDAKKHRRKAVLWAEKLKRDVVGKAKGLASINQASIKKIVKEVSQAYHKLGTIDKKDLQGAIGELEHHWREIKKEAESLRRSVVRTVSRRKKKVSSKKKGSRKR